MTTTPLPPEIKRLKKLKDGHYPFSVKLPALKRPVYVTTEDDARALLKSNTPQPPTTTTHDQD